MTSGSHGHGVLGDLGDWAEAIEPLPEDFRLAERSLIDTVAVAMAARNEPVIQVARHLDDTARWAAAAHALDFDDLHMPTTAHVSAVVVPAVLSASGDERSYLAGSGVMTRVGTMLGWQHYQLGWHITCTAGVFGSAVAAGVAMGLDSAHLATAMALAVPAAGGVHRAFGTMAKPLQVGFAASAGVRAARLAAEGATADPDTFVEWLGLVSQNGPLPDLDGPIISDGLAVKAYPCCYALQRPIAAIASLPVAPEDVIAIHCASGAPSLLPLIHHKPRTGLQGKFSLEYGLAVGILDHPVGFGSFSDNAVARAEAARLMRLVEVTAQPSSAEGLLDGEFEVEVVSSAGRRERAALALPPGAPRNPLTREQLRTKVLDCCGSQTELVMQLNWTTARAFMNELFPSSAGFGRY